MRVLDLNLFRAGSSRLKFAVALLAFVSFLPGMAAGQQRKVRVGSVKPREAKRQPTTTRPVLLGRLPGQLRDLVPNGDIVGVTSRGEPGIVETVGEIMKRELENPQEPYNGIPKTKRSETEFSSKERRPAAHEAELDKLFAPTTIPATLNFLLPQTAGTSIAGPDIASAGFVPPDSMGDVGPSQVLMHANGRIRVYNKATGALGSLNATDANFWNSVRNGAGVSDPHIEYDRLSGRWFICAINVQAAPNRVLVAVSSGPVITNTASFTFFQFTHDGVGATPNVDTGGFADYPTWGVDANAAYMGMNIFNAAGTAVIGTTVYVINKANLIAGTLTVTPFRQIGAAGGTGAGPWTPQAADNDDASFSTGYFVGVDNVSFSLLNVRRVSTPGGTPTLSANLNIAVPTTRFPILQPHLGATTSTRRLDALDDRIFAARIQRNEITGVSTLVAAHNLQVNTLGVGSTTGGRNGSRWYEIGSLTTTPSLVQSGTVFDPAVTNPNGYWIPSVAMSGQGHMAIGMSSAGLTRRAEIFAAGRLRTDALNSTQAPTQIQASSTNYNAEAADGQRWGDYSQTSVDPCDNQTFWTIQEYCDANNSWRMRAIELRAAGPPTAVSPAPASAAAGQSSVNVVVTGTSVGGTEFFDNPPGYLCNANCIATGTGTCRMDASVTSSPLAPAVPLVVNSVTFDSPTQVTLNLNTTGATPGAHTIRIRNPDGQATTFNFTVLAPTAATAPLGGRIVDGRGVTVGGVDVSINDSEGGSYGVTTDSNGEYLLAEALVGRTFVIAPSRPGLTFEPASRAVVLYDETRNVDFVATGTPISAAGSFNDFDGDGRTDHAVFRPSERNWYIWQSATQSLRVENFGLAADQLVPADYDGDSKTDVAVFRAANATWYIRGSRTGEVSTRRFGLSNDLPAAGDYDGDGRADIAVFRPSQGMWYVSAGSGVGTVAWGAAGDRPVPRDFDGDGKVDPTVYRPVEGRWYSRLSGSGTQSIVSFGLASDRIAPGDYDGDGRTDIAVYRPSAGAWFILRSSNGVADIQLFGLEDDQFAGGDFDGDGRSDPALYRPSDSVWYVKQSNGGFGSQKWGMNGDVPAIPGFLR